jgi:hypothetical protein
LLIEMWSGSLNSGTCCVQNSATSGFVNSFVSSAVELSRRNCLSWNVRQINKGRCHYWSINLLSLVLHSPRTNTDRVTGYMKGWIWYKKGTSSLKLHTEYKEHNPRHYSSSCLI